jgi:hypothetical protein
VQHADRIGIILSASVTIIAVKPVIRRYPEESIRSLTDRLYPRRHTTIHCQIGYPVLPVKRKMDKRLSIRMAGEKQDQIDDSNQSNPFFFSHNPLFFQIKNNVFFEHNRSFVLTSVKKDLSSRHHI